jgi:hypothetical protein
MNGLYIRIAPVGLTLCIMQAACISAAVAGPCSAQIEQIEKALSQAGGTSNIGPTGQQTPAAQRHVQPTPQSVEEAKQSARARLDAALARAQSLDAQGDASGCAKEVELLKQLIGLE